MGYPLGKAQLLTEFFRHWDPLIVNESVFRMNSIYRQLGVPLKGGITLSQARERGLIQSGIPWIMISPFMSKSSEFIRAIKSSSNAVTIGFSGWASRTGFKQMMGLDYAMPISDHCDFNELLEIVRCCDPEKIYTIHGSSDGFASRLRAMGYEAEAIMVRKTRDGKGIRRVRRLPLSKDQTLIDSYLG
jgi:putative mRNA 3-end processing factor